MSPKTQPDVAVVIAYFNGMKWIERAIRSVGVQTVAAVELIVVNDGSSADEREALGRIAERHAFRIIDQENAGQGGARNTGAAACSARYICFLDQDDFYLPRHIEDLRSAVPDDDPALGFVYGDFSSADEEGRIFLPKTLAGLQPGRHPKRGDIRNLIRDDMFVLPSATMVTRAVFEAVGGFDPQFKGYEDDDLFLRMFRAGYTNHFVDKPVYVWCQHGGSASNKISMSRSRFRYFQKLAGSFPDDALNGKYYMAECIAPRFRKWFYKDAVRARMGLTEVPEELIGYFNTYVATVIRDPHTRPDVKAALALQKCFLNAAPHLIFRLWMLLRAGSRMLCFPFRNSRHSLR